MPFPILRLPYLAQKCLLNYMEKLEIIKLSLCSRKMDNALKRCGKNGSFFQSNRDMKIDNADSLELFFLEMKRSGNHIIPNMVVFVEISDKLYMGIESCVFIYITLDCIGQIDKYIGKRKYLMIGENCVPIVIDKKGEATTFWNNKANGMISIMEYICVNHKSPIKEMDVNGAFQSDYSTNLRKLVDFMVSSKIEIQSIRVSPEENVSAEDLQYLLENVTVTEKFTTNGPKRVKKGFKFDGKIKADSLSIGGNWFTLQHLLNTDYSEIIIESNGITNEDIRKFMELWVAGEFPSLEKLEFGIKKLRIRNALAGFTVRKYHRHTMKSIKGKNGVYAGLDWRDGLFRFKVFKLPEENEIDEGEEQEELEDDDSIEDEDEEEEEDSDN